jgi:NTP pyrophosphatase (non-canonical NTP hydrolase)
MDFDEYQKLANRTGNFTGKQGEFALMYLGLGVTSEAGEIADKIKKIIRNDNGTISAEKKEALVSEFGDVLWYLSQLARYFDMPFSDVAKANIKKLEDRAARGVIASTGDTR